MDGKRWILGLLATSFVLVAGCGAARSTATPATGGATPGMPSGMVMAPGETMPGMTSTMPTSSTSDGSVVDAPSASAQLTCSPEIKTDVATILALPADLATTTTWSDHLYTCTYHLPAGPLVLSVKESANVPAAQSYAAAVQQRLGATQPLTGLSGLGNPGYDTAGGIVVVRKDDKTLEVDATGLPATVGHQSRADLAYEVASDVLGCWSGQ